MSSATNLPLDPILASRLEAAAQSRGQSPEAVAAEAIESFLDWDDDFRAAVQRGVAEAEAGVFASPAEVAHAFRRRT